MNCWKRYDPKRSGHDFRRKAGASATCMLATAARSQHSRHVVLLSFYILRSWTLLPGSRTLDIVVIFFDRLVFLYIKPKKINFYYGLHENDKCEGDRKQRKLNFNKQAALKIQSFKQRKIGVSVCTKNIPTCLVYLAKRNILLFIFITNTIFMCTNIQIHIWFKVNFWLNFLKRDFVMCTVLM